jgi:Asp-tRNA(Asn)/Glu-tRNA(Gln) amidotransferase A subunit family amidase
VPVNATYTRYPSRILYPVDFFPVANPAAQRLYDDFVATLTREFNFTKTEVNMTAILHAHPVAEISNLTLFQLTSNVLVEHHSWTRVGKPLVALWEAMFGGYPPFDPVPRNAFSRAQRLTDGDYARALSIKRQFGDFFVQNVLSADDDSCSNAILMYDIGTGGLPSYREEHLNALDGATVLSITVPDGGVAKNYLTPMSGCPEMTVPLGQVEYSSHVSMQTEMLPVSVQLVAYRGCEGMLLGLIKEMAEMGYLVETRAGKVAFVL